MVAGHALGMLPCRESGSNALYRPWPLLIGNVGCGLQTKKAAGGHAALFDVDHNGDNACHSNAVRDFPRFSQSRRRRTGTLSSGSSNILSTPGPRVSREIGIWDWIDIVADSNFAYGTNDRHSVDDAAIIRAGIAASGFPRTQRCAKKYSTEAKDLGMMSASIEEALSSSKCLRFPVPSLRRRGMHPLGSHAEAINLADNSHTSAYRCLP